MKFLIFLSFASLYSKSMLSQQIPVNSRTKFYLIRHAEKESGKDPVLTPTGRKRAADLVHTFKHKGIQHIYVSQYQRSQMTSDSMRIKMGIDTVHYTADTTGVDLFNKISQHNDWQHSILVVGHSNTVLRIARRLGVAHIDPADIPDNEFDNLFLVKFKKRKAFLIRKKYGMPLKETTSVQTLQ